MRVLTSQRGVIIFWGGWNGMTTKGGIGYGMGNRTMEAFS